MLSRAAAVFISFSFFGLGSDTINFENQKPGKLPPNWTSVATHATQTPHWEIRQDATAPSRPNVFQQLSTNFPENEFPLAIYDKAICRDGDLSVKFKILNGSRRIKEAGIVWRFQDPGDYYLLRFSSDERNVAVFRVQNGQFHALRGAGKEGGAYVPHEIRTGEWFVTKVVFRGPNFKIFVGNRQLFDVTDEAINRPGKTGLWTRAGTVASFDDFRIDKKS